MCALFCMTTLIQGMDNNTSQESKVYTADEIKKMILPLFSPEKNIFLQAVKNGAYELAELLLKTGEDVNVTTTDKEGNPLYNALYYAVLNRDKAMIQLLIEQKNITFDHHFMYFKNCLCYGNKRYILDWALQCKNYPLTKKLLCEKKASYAEGFIEEISAQLHEFCDDQDSFDNDVHSIVDELYLNRKASPKIMVHGSIICQKEKKKGESEKTYQKKKNKSFYFLFDYFQKKKILFSQEYLDRLLYDAVEGKNTSIVKTLVEYGATPNHRRKNSLRPTLFFLDFYREESLITFLSSHEEIKKRLKINEHVDTDGNSPLHIYMWSTNKFFEQVIRTVHGLGFNINHINKHGETPLHILARSTISYGRESNHSPCSSARLLLDLGADRNTHDSKGKRPIDYFIPSYISEHWHKKYISWCKKNSMAAVLYTHRG